MSEEKTLDEVYRDRNLLALAFARAVQEAYGPEFAWWDTPDADDADADEWAIVYAVTPAGQVSWHVPREAVEGATVPRRNRHWDGHDREEKNDRLELYVNGGGLAIG